MRVGTKRKKYVRSGRYKYRSSPYRYRRSPTDKYAAVMPRLNPTKGLYGFPDELITKVRYGDVYTLTSTTNAVAKNTFRMNSINDPDQTGVGHQVLYNDQLAALYNNYVVLGSKITVQFSLISNSTSVTQPSGPVVVGLLTETDSTSSSTLSTLMESSNSVSTFLNVSQGGNNIKTLKATFAPLRDLGLSSTDDTVGAAFNANPSQQFYCHAWMVETGLASPTSCNIKVMIEYTIKCKKLVDVTGS